MDAKDAEIAALKLEIEALRLRIVALKARPYYPCYPQPIPTPTDWPGYQDPPYRAQWAY